MFRGVPLSMSLLRRTPTHCAQRGAFSIFPQVLPELHTDQKRSERTVRFVSSSSSNDENKERMMPFEEYISLRDKINSRSTIATIPFGFASLFGSAYAVAATVPHLFDAPPEELQLIMGMDPALVAGAGCTFFSMFAAVAGRSLFKVMWRVLNPELSRKLIERREDFLDRIDRNRTVGENFSDDFYGDKITSLSAYRVWLRQQRERQKLNEKLQTI